MTPFSISPEQASADACRTRFPAGDLAGGPCSAALDPALPMLATALDMIQMQSRLQSCIAATGNSQELAQLRAIRITRWKPSRRCVIEYDVQLRTAAGPSCSLTLVAKVHARKPDLSTPAILTQLRQAGFDDDCVDGICVPRTWGMIPELHMSLQQKVSGTKVTDFLGHPECAGVMRRVAEAAHKLHQADIHTTRQHTIADEVRILEERLPGLCETFPEWSKRIDRLLGSCAELVCNAPVCAPAFIHRDFYPDQILIDRSRIWLLDFDLSCRGDAGLDIGNFIGHLTELSLRTYGDPVALEHLERAMESRFIQCSAATTRTEVRTYAFLTLVRHIQLSTQFPERRPFTQALLELCEQRRASFERDLETKAV